MNSEKGASMNSKNSGNMNSGNLNTS